MSTPSNTTRKGRGYRERAQRGRGDAASRVRARLSKPVSAQTRAKDPLARPKRSPWFVAAVLGLALGALLLHAVTLGLFVLLGSVLAVIEPPEAINENIVVHMIEPPPPPPPVESEPAAEAESQKPVREHEAPPPDPIDTREIAPESMEVNPEPSESKPRRIVGLSLESTVVGGGGPSFAVGNTRMGKTAEVAEDPETITTPQNRVATRAPTRHVRVTKPRLRGDPVEPDYPKELQLRGIEGDVVVVVFIDTEGNVQTAKVVKPSPYEEFNTAALAAAKKRKFYPATRGDEPIATSLKFTIRFRLKDE